MFKEQNLCLLHPLMLKVILGVDWSLYSLNSFCFCFLWFLGPMKVSLIIVGVKSHFKVLNLFVQSVLSFLQALTSKSLVPTQQHLEACPQCKILGSVPDLFNQNLHFWQELCVIWSISTFKFEKFWTRTFWDGRQPLCWPRDEQVVDPSQFPLSWHLGCPPLFKSPSILPLQSLLPSKAELVIQHRAQSIDRGVRNDWACARARARTDTHTHTYTPSPGTPIEGTLSSSQLVDTITLLWWSLGCERWGLLDGPQDAGLYHLWSLMFPWCFLWEGVVNLSVLADFQSL